MAIAKARLGKKGEIIIPSSITRMLGLSEHDLVEIEATAEGIIVKPVQLPLKMKDIPKEASDKPGEME